jgi:hypothetical protein
MRPAAEKAQAAATAAHHDAEIQGAAGFAKADYDAAEALEKKAAADLAAGNYTAARDGFAAAAAGFEKAAAATRAQAEAAATTARLGMQQAKDAADAVSAKSMVPEEYAEGERLEKLATKALETQQFALARQQFTEATIRYDKAAEAARSRASNPDYAAAVEAQKAMEQAKAACAHVPGGKRANPQYMSWAEIQEQKAQNELKAGQWKRAAKFFGDARLFYVKAVETAK